MLTLSAKKECKSEARRFAGGRGQRRLLANTANAKSPMQLPRSAVRKLIRVVTILHQLTRTIAFLTIRSYANLGEWAVACQYTVIVPLVSTSVVPKIILEDGMYICSVQISPSFSSLSTCSP